MEPGTEASNFDEVKAWLKGYADSVNNRNYSRARDLFMDLSKVYGLRVSFCDNIDDAIDKEWKKEWPNITGFTWDYEKRMVYETDRNERYFSMVFLPWQATGYTITGTKFKRSGRTTMEFLRPANGPIKCYHAHFSFNPGVPAETFGVDAGIPKSESHS